MSDTSIVLLDAAGRRRSPATLPDISRVARPAGRGAGRLGEVPSWRSLAAWGWRVE
jgi:hypothetical protein